MKSACKVSAPSALLASVLSKAGWSVIMTWKVRLHVDLPVLSWRVTRLMGLIGRLAYGSSIVLDGKILEAAGWKCGARGCRIYLERNLRTAV